MIGTRFVRWIALAAALAVSGAACSHSPSGSNASPTTAVAAKAPVLVAIGSNATLADKLAQPLRDAWPQRLYHLAFGTDAVLVNAAINAADVKEALAHQVPLALEVHATVAVVWLGADDVRDKVSVSTYENEMGTLVSRLRAGGARVYVGNLPTGGVPEFSAYNAALARAAAAHGATVVDIDAALAGQPVVRSGSQIDAPTSLLVAKAFAAAVTAR